MNQRNGGVQALADAAFWHSSAEEVGGLISLLGVNSQFTSATVQLHVHTYVCTRAHNGD